MPSKKNQQNYWSFYPSEPFTIAHFNVRHPVSTLADTDFFLDFLYQGGVKSTVFGVFEVLKLKFSAFWNFKLEGLKL